MYPQILSAQDNTSEKTEVTFMVSGTGDYAKTQKEKLEQQLLPYFPDIEITVEAYPEESEGFFQGGTGVGQHADFVFLAFNQRGELFEELSVSLTFVGKGGFKTCFHVSEFSDIKTGSLPKKRTC